MSTRLDSFALIVNGPLALRGGTVEGLVSAHRALDGFVQKVTWQLPRARGSKILLDLRQCTGIDPTGVLLLMYCTHLLQQQGHALWLRADGVILNKLEAYLHDLGSGIHFSPVRARSGHQILREIHEPDEMITTVESWAQCVQRHADAREEDVARWQMQICEVLTNAFQHGGGSTTHAHLVAGEAEPRAKYVHLAALDFGCGIPAVIRPHAPVEIGVDDGSLIRFACGRGVTARTVPENQGAGLADLVEGVLRSVGSLSILSSGGLYHVTGKRGSATRTKHRTLTVVPPLRGTLTVIRLGLTRGR